MSGYQQHEAGDDEPEQPELVPLRLDGLDEIDELELRVDDHHSRVSLTDADLSGMSLPRLGLDEVEFSQVTLDETDLTGAHLREVRWRGCTATSLRASRGDWRDVEIEASRFGALEMYDARVRGLSVEVTRLGYVNMRGARLRDVRLRGCRIGDLDLTEAHGVRLSLVDCEVETLTLRGAEFGVLDLRGARLGGVIGLQGLRGAVCTPQQLDLLAPLLADHVGLRVRSAASSETLTEPPSPE